MYTLKCVCRHTKAEHNEKGCNRRGCICKHGEPATKEELLKYGFNENDIQILYEDKDVA